MSSQESKAQAVKDFMEVFPDLVEEFLREVRTRNFPEEAVQWIKKVHVVLLIHDLIANFGSLTFFLKIT